MKSILPLNETDSEDFNQLKTLCKYLEKTFFHDDDQSDFCFEEHQTRYIFGDKPTIADYVLYLELLSAMLVPRIGRIDQLFSNDSRFRLLKIRKLNKWFYMMSWDTVNRRLA